MKKRLMTSSEGSGLYPLAVSTPPPMGKVENGPAIFLLQFSVSLIFTKLFAFTLSYCAALNTIILEGQLVISSDFNGSRIITYN